MTKKDRGLKHSKIGPGSLQERLARFTGGVRPAAGAGDSGADAAAVAARLGDRPSAPRVSGTVWALIDTSGSMAGDPIEQARRGLEDFARQAIGKGYRVGVFGFSHRLSEISAPVDDPGSVVESLSRLEAGGGTAMAPAFERAARRLADERDGRGERIILLVTDGWADDPDETLAAAEAARAAGIDVMTLGTEDADHVFLRRLSSRDELARETPKARLREGISRVAGLLPGPGS